MIGRQWGGLWEWAWLVPACVCLMVILRYGLTVLYWDELSIAGFLVTARDRGYPTWAELIAQHNESRKFFPRLLFLANTYLGDANPKRIMVINWGLLVVTVLMLRAVARRTLGGESKKIPGLAAVVTIVAGCGLLTLAQWQNLLWGIQVVVTVPIFALAFSLWCSGWNRPLWLRGLLCGLAATVATFSYANGMVVWPLAGMALALAPRSSVRARVAIVGAMVAAALAAIVYYRHGYVHPGSHPKVDIVLKEPTLAVKFVMAFLANGIRATTDIDTNIWIGWAGAIAAFLAAGALAVRAIRQKDPSDLLAAWPWLLLMAYSLISAGTTAVGRLGFGVAYALSERYVSFGIAFWVGLVPVVALALDLERDQAGNLATENTASRHGCRQAAALFGLGALAMMYLMSLPLAMRESSQYANSRATALAASTWIDVAPNLPQVMETLFPLPAEAQQRIHDLAARKILPFHLASSKNVDDYAKVQFPAENSSKSSRIPSYGAVDDIHREGATLHVSGWAVAPGDVARAADAVILAMVRPDGSQEIVAMTGTTHYVREDISKARRRFSGECGFYLAAIEGKSLKSPLPPGTEVQIWAYNRQNHAMRPIGLPTRLQ